MILIEGKNWMKHQKKSTLYLLTNDALKTRPTKNLFWSIFFSLGVIFRIQQYSFSGDLGRAVHSVCGHVEPGMYTCRAPYWVTSLPWRWWGGIFPWKTDTKHYKEATKLFLKGDQLALAIEAVGSPPVSLVARSVWSGQVMSGHVRSGQVRSVWLQDLGWITFCLSSDIHFS